MASNPHSDFTTHNRSLPTLSNLLTFTTLSARISTAKCHVMGFGSTASDLETINLLPRLFCIPPPQRLHGYLSHPDGVYKFSTHHHQVVSMLLLPPLPAWYLEEDLIAIFTFVCGCFVAHHQPPDEPCANDCSLKSKDIAVM